MLVTVARNPFHVGQSPSTVVIAPCSRSQIDDPARRIECPRVAVPFFAGRGVAPVGARQSLHRSHRRCAGKLGRKARPGAARGCFPADQPGQVQAHQRRLMAPMRSGPDEPLAPGRHEAPIVRVSVGEFEGERIFGELRRRGLVVRTAIAGNVARGSRRAIVSVRVTPP